MRANPQPHDRDDTDTSSPPRCFSCFRPRRLCFCDAIPTVQNRTSVLILQHRRERFHPFNTARIVNRALERCELIVGHNADLSNRFDAMPLSDGAGLLFPGDQARLLTELASHEYPKQLVIPDGTWHHVKTLMRDVPRLRTLPRYRLAPASPGNYRIRREPDAHGLSTLEATVAALRTMEPETDGLDRLIDLFDRMVDDQLAQGTTNWRHNQRRRLGIPNVPRTLTGELDNIVVAYGEQERGKRSDVKEVGEKRKPLPIYWTAVRLVSGERFRCAIESESLHDESFLGRLRLTPLEIQPAVSIDAFRDRWNSFLRPQDHLAVYHPSTAKLLETVHAQISATLILKSINATPESGTIDELPSVPGIHASLHEETRASQRLANAVAFVEYLNHRYRRSDLA